MPGVPRDCFASLAMTVRRRESAVLQPPIFAFSALPQPTSDFHFVFLKAGDDAPAARSDAGQSRATSGLQYFIASACWASAPDFADTKAASDNAEAIAI